MSQAKKNANTRSKRENEKNKEENDDEDLIRIRNILSKLNLKDQLRLERDFLNIPKTCTSVWRQYERHLDLRNIERKLNGNSLRIFLKAMCQDFHHIYFQSEQLQEELNILERAGIGYLPGVQFAEICWNDQQQNYRKMITCGSGSSPLQWPLHALPKLLKNLRRLKVHSPILVCFIEQFSKLEYLTLYDEVSPLAMNAILSECRRLKHLHFLGKEITHQLKGISKCGNRLKDLVLTVDTFLTSWEEILLLPQLLVLELRPNENVTQTMNAMSHVIRKCGSQLKSLQINCRYLDPVKCISQLKLNNYCRHFSGLVLSECRFDDHDFSVLQLPKVRGYAVFCQCSDLKNKQIIDFIKSSSSKLREIYLITCPLLTNILIDEIYKVRSSEHTTECPLMVKLDNCPNIWTYYEKNFVDIWQRRQNVLQVENLQHSYNPNENVQFLFRHRTEVHYTKATK